MRCRAKRQPEPPTAAVALAASLAGSPRCCPPNVPRQVFWLAYHSSPRAAPGCSASPSSSGTWETMAGAPRCCLSGTTPYRHARPTRLLDLMLLMHWHGAASVGIYSVATGIGERLWLLSYAAGTALLPQVARATARGAATPSAQLSRLMLWGLMLPAAALGPA